MQEANALVAALAEKNDQLEYVDTTTPMLGPDGQPRRELFLDDGLHLNENGYATWNTVLEPVLQSALSTR
jgi:lysophospholipase L1-like esterase